MITLKIIHCADVHLASALEASLSATQARQRRDELLARFGALVRYAQENDVRALIIAGDLFDAGVVPARTRDYVFDLMRSAPEIEFFYARGNHDAAVPPQDVPNLTVPPRDGQWLLRRVGAVTIALCDPKKDDAAYPARLKLDAQNVNIVVLHGNIGAPKTMGQELALKDFAGKNIDYLALGHLHAYRTGQLDTRGTWCYSGCLEGRGFDECGVKGFVELNVDVQRIAARFVPFALRTMHARSADLRDCRTMQQVEQAVLAAVSDIPQKDMVRLTLKGECDAALQKDTEYLLQLLRGRFFAARLHDDTRVRVDLHALDENYSLTGTFVRIVRDSALDEEQKQRVIACGLRVLGGGEVTL